MVQGAGAVRCWIIGGSHQVSPLRVTLLGGEVLKVCSARVSCMINIGEPFLVKDEGMDAMMIAILTEIIVSSLHWSDLLVDPY